ncbi:hypothetical protein [Solibacillus sp. FSL K6-1523]|uniref:hypothetical protein n=1 Tax=Solibacillus sp. FSL K6-1523 TaxID=2921471 RepID=UPI0030F8EC48
MITEYTILEFKGLQLSGTPYHYWVLKLSDNLFYAGYNENEIETATTVGWARSIAKEEYALEYIGFLQNFFDINGKRRLENVGMTIPPLVGLAEAADILGWDKRKVSTYIKRGSFPNPLKKLASGPIWTYKQIDDYKMEITKII